MPVTSRPAAAALLRPADPVRALPGITAPRAEALATLGVTSVEDLLRLSPRRYEDRRRAVPLAEVRPGGDVLVVARVASSDARRLRGGVSLLEARLEDASGTLVARWFARGFLPTPLAVGARYALFGPAREQRGRVVLVGPERERLDDDAEPRERGLVPVHPLARGLTAGTVRRLVRAALPALAALPEPLPERVKRALGLPDLDRAIAALHFPARIEEAEASRKRLAFDELLEHDLLLERRRRRRAAQTASPIPFPERVAARIRARLPFALTPAQERVTAEVTADLARAVPMQRLLQGEVGSGKTLVAAYALLGAVAARLQGAVLAPTEVLARQHEATLARLLAGSRVRLAALTGGLAPRRRAALLHALAAGEIDVLVGTHALVRPEVVFHRLGLVVVDEQHKFGVRQRAALAAKGHEGRVPHCLVMTATPIPRTLALTVYGDLDVSVIDGLPPGRRPVETWVVRPRDGARVMARVRRELADGRQAFVVYPAVDEGAGSGLKAAVEGAGRWQRALPGRRVGLLHGRLAAAEKRRVLDAFRARALDVLVATVVVEVGVDVPNASLLVVEQAERFGLTQLHQLRGRVGRGTTGGLCVLVDRSADGLNARLEVLARTHDGLAVAEHDLALRGVGDLVGARQSGMPGFRAARLPADLALLARAREAARALLDGDPLLARPENAVLADRIRRREEAARDVVAPD